MSTRILVVDDEPDYLKFVTDVLTKENFTVMEARDGEQALLQAAKTPPDLVLIDWNLPGMNGLEVCRELKNRPTTAGVPVVMLTVRRRETDTVLALTMGADDFITKKAFRPREFVARLQAVLRRVRGAAPAEVLTAGTITVNVAERRVTVGGAEVELRTKEFDLLRLFLEKKGRVLTRSFLHETVWGAPDFGTSRTLDTTLSNLRARLGTEGERIQSLKNAGYRFDG
jgi:DNA-binding response OmpR family regulator